MIMANFMMKQTGPTSIGPLQARFETLRWFVGELDWHL